MANDEDDKQARHLPTSSLLDVLTPPTGYIVDRALCSAYSGQCAVFVAMLAAMVRQGTAEGKGSSDLALARALERLKDRVHFLVQHGRIIGPRSASPILNMLDRFVVPVKYDERKASWHPKVCVVRCVNRYSAQAKPIWRLWIGSRNFTMDESWDMALSLTGEVDRKGDELADVESITRRLAQQAGVEAQWLEALQELGTVRWQVPAGLRIDKLALFTHGGLKRDLEPVPANARSVLAVSPFLDEWGVSNLLRLLPPPTDPLKKPRLISTMACLSEIAKKHRPALARYNLRSLPESSQDDPPEEIDEPASEGADAGADAAESRGLHAKFVWIETPKRGELRLGSTNLTKRGWKENAEVLAIVSVALPGGDYSKQLRSGLKAFDDFCSEYELGEEEATPDDELRLQREFDDARNALVVDFVATQALQGCVAVVTLQSPLHMPTGACLRVGRIGDALLPWDAGVTSLNLPDAPAHDNGDLLRMELVMGGLSSEWLQHVPFVPSLSRDARDVPLLHAYLGIDGVISLLNDSLTAGGNGGGSRRPWNKPHTAGASVQTIPLLGIEAVLSSWVRDKESLSETQRIVEIARKCEATSKKEEKAIQQLKAFLTSWDAIEQELIKP
ncbi:MAG TPA: hypothetical protein VGU65_12700 [Frateuria sp.]|uniref:hypothetical protein n=1 Tax=Frateuria sp. TaxID=2211372 RepID=UPI002DEADAD6|nr:hypothetical protein [Frateuria sp.]